MFNFDFFELMVIAVVALVVVGPERMPAVARAAGRMMGRFQRFMNTMAADLNKELEIDEMKKLHQQTKLELDKANEEARAGMRKVEQTVAHAELELNKTSQSIAQETSAPVGESVHDISDSSNEIVSEAAGVEKQVTGAATDTVASSQKTT